MKYFKYRLFVSDTAVSCRRCNSPAVFRSIRGWLYLDEKAYYANYRSDNKIVHNHVRDSYLDIWPPASDDNKPSHYIRLCPRCKSFQYGITIVNEVGGTLLLNFTSTIKRC